MIGAYNLVSTTVHLYAIITRRNSPLSTPVKNPPAMQETWRRGF